MLFDIAYKLARKSMPSGLYDAISYDLLGRRANYEKKGTYEAIYRHYIAQSIDFRGKTVVEAGSGLQYFTSLYFFSAGAAEVSLVEPKLAFDADVLRKTVDAFNRGADKPMSFEDVRSRIRCYRDLRLIPEERRESADLLLSYTVLEHVADLGSFFSECARVLKPGALAYHLVDLSDHTYQVFARWRLTSPLNAARALYHLRYSPRMFRLLNDPKCYMNRALLPHFLQAAEAGGFRVARLETQPFRGEVRIHPALLGGLNGAPEQDLRVQTFSLALEKPAGSPPSAA